MADREDTLLEFPCDFPIKMMGRDEDSFREAAIAVIEEHAGKLSDDAISTSSSRKGNFVSITVTISAQSQQQLDDIYQALTDHEEILVAL
jgi:putative lipoic acid-binding regulatory protein